MSQHGSRGKFVKGPQGKLKHSLLLPALGKPRVNGGSQWFGLQPRAVKFAVPSLKAGVRGAQTNPLRWTCYRIAEAVATKKDGTKKTLRNRVVHVMIDTSVST